MTKIPALWLIFVLSIIIVSCLVYHLTVETFSNDRAPIARRIDAIYYINLEKREDRKQEFLDNFNEVDEDRIVRVKAHYYPENGAVGCLMSHINALNVALTDGLGENILICEDDFTIKDMDYCNKMLDFLFDEIPDWDVVMLGQNTIDSEETGIETSDGKKIVRIRNSQTTSGYLIKARYIPRLLEIYERDMKQFVQTGEWGNYYTDQSWKVLQAKDRWYSFQPTVGVQRPSYSDIQNGSIGTEV
jgi:GR25 family glycosyltransferase involved in LPS biosynthesis